MVKDRIATKGLVPYVGFLVLSVSTGDEEKLREFHVARALTTRRSLEANWQAEVH